ncbi:MAG: DUF2344 domain-containing protein [Firmicutes bacterium]|nr:DUF2344 domain-containing protein [Candidatus Fermentithermobacillaceae bacterium]
MKVRIRYEKGDEQRFLGHLEVMRALVMALARAGWPVEMTKGYTPRPKVEMVAPLPVGTAGFNEVADVYLSEDRPIEELARSLAKAMPPGFKLKEVWRISPDETALERRITASTYRVLVYGAEHASLKRAVDRFLDREEAKYAREIPDHAPETPKPPDASRKSREIDLRPFVSRIEVTSGDEPALSSADGTALATSGEVSPPLLKMVLRHFEGRTVRPAWVLEYLVKHCGLEGVDPRESVVDREWLDWGDGGSHGSRDPRKRRQV